MYDDGYSSGAVAATILAVYGAIFVFSLLLAAGIYVLMALSLSSLFKKVGIESWIAWVPYYNTWKWLELGGQRGWLALLALIPYGSIVTAVFLYIGMYRTGKAFGKDGAFVVLGIFLPFVWAFILGGRNGGDYHPEWFAAYGWPPPYAGYGAVPAEARQPAGYAQYGQPQYGQPQYGQQYPPQQQYPGQQAYPAQPTDPQQYPGQQPPVA